MCAISQIRDLSRHFRPGGQVPCCASRTAAPSALRAAGFEPERQDQAAGWPTCSGDGEGLAEWIVTSPGGCDGRSEHGVAVPDGLRKKIDLGALPHYVPLMALPS